MFEKNLNIAFLLDFYGEVLSDRKREVLDAYYNDDLSLAEIATDLGISRQGVRDLIKRSEEQLRFFEDNLGLSEKNEKLREIAANCGDAKVKEEIEKLLQE